MTLGPIERLTTEFENLSKDRKFMFYANPILTGNKLNLFKWECSFPGPNTELYRGSYYYVTLNFTKEYPFKPPKVKFEHFVFHPNVYRDGAVCLDILQTKWKSGFGVMKILTALQALLLEPNINSPANGEVGTVLRKSEKEYEVKVRENIQKFHMLPDFLRKD